MYNNERYIIKFPGVSATNSEYQENRFSIDSSGDSSSIPLSLSTITPMTTLLDSTASQVLLLYIVTDKDNWSAPPSTVTDTYGNCTSSCIHQIEFDNYYLTLVAVSATNTPSVTIDTTNYTGTDSYIAYGLRRVAFIYDTTTKSYITHDDIADGSPSLQDIIEASTNEFDNDKQQIYLEYISRIGAGYGTLTESTDVTLAYTALNEYACTTLSSGVSLYNTMLGTSFTYSSRSSLAAHTSAYSLTTGYCFAVATMYSTVSPTITNTSAYKLYGVYIDTVTCSDNTTIYRTRIVADTYAFHNNGIVATLSGGSYDYTIRTGKLHYKSSATTEHTLTVDSGSTASFTMLTYIDDDTVSMSLNAFDSYMCGATEITGLTDEEELALMGQYAAQITAQEETIASNTATITAQNTTIAANTATITSQETTIANNNTTITTQTTTIASNDTTISEQESTIDSNTETNNTLISQCQTYQAQLAVLQGEITSLTAQKTALEEAISSLELSDAQEQLALVNAQIATKTAQYNAIQESLEAIQSEAYTGTRTCAAKAYCPWASATLLNGWIPTIDYGE